MRAGDIAACLRRLCLFSLKGRQHLSHFKGGMHVLSWQKPSLHLTCPPRMRLGGERLYTLLRPTACQGREGHAVARGDCRRHADSQQPLADSGQPRPPLPVISSEAKRSREISHRHAPAVIEVYAAICAVILKSDCLTSPV